VGWGGGGVGGWGGGGSYADLRFHLANDRWLLAGCSVNLEMHLR
jgi:hypothetical protein